MAIARTSICQRSSALPKYRSANLPAEVPLQQFDIAMFTPNAAFSTQYDAVYGS